MYIRRFLLLSFLLSTCFITRAQDVDSETIEKNLVDIFGPPPDAATVVPTVAPTIVNTEDGGNCICVPYYLCDPNNNTIQREDTITGFGIIDVRFDANSCQESVEVCCKEPRDESDPVKVIEHPERTAGCGLRNANGIDFQISGGSAGDSQFGEFPWTVAILSTADSSSLCAGSLIHPQIVLTAAHCISKYRPLEVKARMGEWDTQTTKERFPHQEKSVTRILSHPNYNSKTLANDVALVFLSDPVTITDNVNTVCLPTQNQNLENAEDCYVTGWGKKNFGQTGRYSVIMKKVKLSAVPYNKCQTQMRKTRLGPRFNLDRTFICAGGKKGVDACQGDGGAPLVCPNGSGKYQQAGIVAWGIGCGEENVPGIYGYVSKFRSWIDTSVTQAGFNPSSYTSA